MEVERLKFYKWLERRISKQKMTDLLMDVEQIETYVKKRGLADEPIFSIKDPEQVEKIRTSVSRANNNFSYGKRRIFVELLSYYHEYRTIHEELMDVESGDNHESKNRHLDTISLDSENNQKTDENSQKPEHSYTQPVAVVYSGNEVKVSSWRQVYTTVCKLLIEDYPQKILQLRDSQETGVSNLIYDADEATQLRNPVQFSDGFFVETLADASELMKNTRILLDYCKVDYKDVVIRYKRNSEQEANPKKKKKQKTICYASQIPYCLFSIEMGLNILITDRKEVVFG